MSKHRVPRLLVWLFLVAAGATTALSGCGDGGGEASGSTASSSSSNPPPANPPANNAPTISGSAPTQVLVDADYAFTPTVNDPDGDSLSFVVQNLPEWANFNSTNGAVTGSPESMHVGMYANIRITISDGEDSDSLTFSVNVVDTASGTALLSWTAPTQNTNGSQLLDLNRYNIYWGPDPGNYTHSESVGEGATNFLVENLTPGTWYFAATAVNDLDLESGYSNVASKTIL